MFLGASTVNTRSCKSTENTTPPPPTPEVGGGSSDLSPTELARRERLKAKSEEIAAKRRQRKVAFKPPPEHQKCNSSMCQDCVPTVPGAREGARPALYRRGPWVPTPVSNRFPSLGNDRSWADQETTSSSSLSPEEQALEEFYELENDLAVLKAREEDDLLDESDQKNTISESSGSGFWGHSVGR